MKNENIMPCMKRLACKMARNQFDWTEVENEYEYEYIQAQSFTHRN